jgi:hypothetical protein
MTPVGMTAVVVSGKSTTFRHQKTSKPVRQDLNPETKEIRYGGGVESAEQAKSACMGHLAWWFRQKSNRCGVKEEAPHFGGAFEYNISIVPTESDFRSPLPSPLRE